MGSFSSKTGVNCNLRVDWTQTKNTTANTSSITVTVYMVHNSLYMSGVPMNINCMGQTKAVKTPSINKTGSGFTTQIGTATFTVNHNSDGTKSGVISAVIPNFGVTYAGVYLANISASANVTLDSIPRASTFSASATSVYAGEQITFYITKASESFTHKMRYSLPHTNGGTGKSGTLTISETPYKWTVPSNFIDVITIGDKQTLTLTLETYNGSTKVGEKPLTVEVKVPTNVVPSISKVTTSATSDNATVKGWGIYLKGYSKAVCAITASAPNNATITKYRVGNKTATSNSITTDVLTNLSNTFEVEVTDSRGRTAKTSVTVNAQDYSEPYLKNISCYRSNSSGVKDDTGTYLYMIATSAFASCGGKNKATITYSVERVSNGASAGSGTLTSGTASKPNILNAAYMYRATITVTDSIGGSNSYTYDIKTKNISFNLYPSAKGGAAFGKYAEYEETLDIKDWQILSSKLSTNYVTASNGAAIINSTAEAGKYVALARLHSNNGYMIPAVNGGSFEVSYVQSNTDGNVHKYRAILLNESGNASFPMNVNAGNVFTAGASSNTAAKYFRVVNQKGSGQFVVDANGKIGIQNVNTTNWIIVSDAEGKEITIGSTDMNISVASTIKSSLNTGTYLKGNQGVAIINSSSTGTYTILAKLNSTNGYFTDGVHGAQRVFMYTSKETVEKETNGYTKRVVLLNESGNSEFPGTVSMAGAKISGSLTLTKTTDASGTADNGPALIVGGERTAAHLEFDSNEIMAKASGTTVAPLYLNSDGGDIYLGGNGIVNAIVNGTIKATDFIDKDTGRSIAPIFEGTNANGCVRFPSIKLQICWMKYTAASTGVAIATAWGSLYTGAHRTLPNWYKAFNAQPVIFRQGVCYQNASSAAGVITATLGDGSTSSPGNAEVIRGTKIEPTGSSAYYGEYYYAIAIGTYA